MRTRRPYASQYTRGATGLGYVEILPEKEEGDASSQFQVWDPSEDQKYALAVILPWIGKAKGTNQILTLGGYAGSGKTSTLGVVAQRLTDKLRIAFCAYTGKASGVLRRSLKAQGVSLSGAHFCGTLHRLIYKPLQDKVTGRILGWERRPFLDYDLIIVDEASMVSDTILQDLRSYKIPVLAVGDHGQLPPVRGQGALMQNPRLRLEQVHRQAADNPVIALATAVRNGEDWLTTARAFDDPRLVIADSNDSSYVMERVAQDPLSSLLLCHTNRTRVNLNRMVRRKLQKQDSALAVGDVVICLKNAYLDGFLVANGMRGVVEALFPKGPYYEAQIAFPEEGFRLHKALLLREQFGREYTFRGLDEVETVDARKWDELGLLFDHGYALTVHKSQGGQADLVVVCVEPSAESLDDFNRWMYTAITRSSSRLVLVE